MYVILLLSQAINAVDNTAQDRANYMAKIEIMPLLKNQAETVYVEERNLDKDLNIAEIAKYFNCQTLAGAHFLESTLRLPISPKSNCAVVAKRQALNMALCQHSEFKAEVEALTAEFARAEKVILELMSRKYRGMVCPEEEPLKILKKDSPKIYRFLYPLNVNQNIRTAAALVSLGGLAFDAAIASGKIYSPTHKMLKMCGAGEAILEKFDIMTRVNSAFSVAIGTYTTIKNHRRTIEKRDKIHALSTIVAIAERFEDLCAQYGVEPQFKISAISDVATRELIHELKKSRYSQEHSVFFLSPRVDAFLYSLYEKDGCLANFFACAAEMDAYNAIATKMLELQNQSNQFCFAKFMADERAQINANGFWNILVNGHKIVANDLNEAKNVIFSGVNGGGKTSSTRAILQNIVLAQTFGIAAAREFAFTAFDIIHAYLNVSDDLMAGESLFVSEVKRAQEVKEKIKSIAGTNLKFFFALDELFTGTSDKAGQDCACNFLENIVQSPNIMFIYPTHFDKLKELGETNEYCVNYKVDTAIKNEEGKLVYPFTISRGASYDNIAIDIAANANLFN